MDYKVRCFGSIFFSVYGKICTLNIDKTFKIKYNLRVANISQHDINSFEMEGG